MAENVTGWQLELWDGDGRGIRFKAESENAEENVGISLLCDSGELAEMSGWMNHLWDDFVKRHPEDFDDTMKPIGERRNDNEDFELYLSAFDPEVVKRFAQRVLALLDGRKDREQEIE